MGLLGRRREKPGQAQEKGIEPMPRTIIALTPEQRAAALEKAAVAKAEKKKLLDDLREGRVQVLDLLGEGFKDNDRVQKLQVATMLRAAPGVNPARVKLIMESIGIDEGRKIQGLGVRQHAKLVDWLKTL